MTKAIEAADVPGYYERLLNQLGDLVTLVRGNLSSIARAVLSALIVVEVKLHLYYTYKPGTVKMLSRNACLNLEEFPKSRHLFSLSKCFFALEYRHGVYCPPT